MGVGGGGRSPDDAHPQLNLVGCANLPAAWLAQQRKRGLLNEAVLGELVPYRINRLLFGMLDVPV